MCPHISILRCGLQDACAAVACPMTRTAILIHLSSTQSGRRGAFRDRTTPQKVFTALWTVEAEVDNGGFAQYFCKTTTIVTF